MWFPWVTITFATISKDQKFTQWKPPDPNPLGEGERVFLFLLFTTNETVGPWEYKRLNRGNRGRYPTNKW